MWTCLRRLTLKQRFPCFIALCFFLVLFPDVDSVKAFYPINVPLNHCHQSVIPRSAIEVVRSACQKLNRAEPLPCFQMNTPDLGQRMGALEVFLLPPKISPYLVGKIWRLISWAPSLLAYPGYSGLLQTSMSKIDTRPITLFQTFFASLAGQSMSGTFCIPNC